MSKPTNPSPKNHEVSDAYTEVDALDLWPGDTVTFPNGAVWAMTDGGELVYRGETTKVA